MYTIQQFCHMVDTNLNAFMAQLQAQTITASTPNSYVEVSKMLKNAMQKNPSIAKACITTTANLLVEYKLPQAAAYCDIVLLGGGIHCPQAIIVELKDYSPNCTDEPGSYEGLMWHGNQAGMNEISHPSDQLKGYVEYCRNFHSAITDANGTKKAEVTGCVFFTKKGFDDTPYGQVPNDKLVQDYPTYTITNSGSLADYIAETITKPDTTFSSAFEMGGFVQNRNIMNQVAQNLRNAASAGLRPFVLLDNQRKGLQQTLSAMEQACKSNQKTVVIVQGPPGSGKSAIAINLLLESIGKYNDKGNIFFVTTSASQEHNWAYIFNEAGGLRNGAGIQKKAASFKPQGLNSVQPLRMAFPDYANNNTMDPSHYEEYVNYVINTNTQREYGDNVDFLTITDESHALINPLSPYYTGHRQGFANFSGPEAYHIIRRSKVSVFFTDPEQSFRDFESTSIKDITDLALHLRANVIHVDLGKMQFRCAGSVDYIEWVDQLFSNKPLNNHIKWSNFFDVQVFKSPSDMEKHLRSKGTQSIRLLSSYSVPWISANFLQAIHNPRTPYDFDLPDKDLRWRKYWNNRQRYDIFVQNTPPSSMALDPLCEVGCPYVVRGFDFDYVGVLMLNDIVWRSDKWMINFANCHETATKSRRKMAVEEIAGTLVKKGLTKNNAINQAKAGVFEADNPSLPQTQHLFKTIRQAYRILLTRGIKGMYLCIPDDETRNYIKSLL